MDLVPIAVPKHFHCLTRVLCPWVDHGYENPFNGKVRVDLPADLANRPDQLLKPVQGKLGRLDRNEYAVRTGKGIDGHQPQRRGTVEKNVVIAWAQPGNVLLQNKLPAHDIDESQFHTFERFIGRNKINSFPVVEDGILDLILLNDGSHNCGDRGLKQGRLPESEACCQASLTVTVQEQDLLSLLCEPDPEIYGCGGFTHPAFHIYD